MDFFSVPIDPALLGAVVTGAFRARMVDLKLNFGFGAESARTSLSFSDSAWMFYLHAPRFSKGESKRKGYDMRRTSEQWWRRREKVPRNKSVDHRLVGYEMHHSLCLTVPISVSDSH